MKKRQAAIDESYEAQWDGGRGSHHPDYDPTADGSDVKKASRETEELLMAIIKVRSEALFAAPLRLTCGKLTFASRTPRADSHRMTSASCTRRLRKGLTSTSSSRKPTVRTAVGPTSGKSEPSALRT